MRNKVKNREELFENSPVWSAILTLTVPMILGSIVSIVYNLSDTYFVGALKDPIQNAAITLAAPAMVLFYAVTNLFGVGASSLMSRSMGIKDTEAVKKASATGLYLALVLSAVLSLVTLIFNKQTLAILGTDAQTYQATKEYMFWTVGLGSVPGIMSIMFSYLLRAEGRSMQASIGQMSGCFLNIILDPFFIMPWGLNMGASGAGLATFISNCIALLFFIVFVLREKNNTYVCLNPRYMSFEKKILSSILAVGIPGVFQNVLNVIGMTMLNNIIASNGADAVAAVGIANKINQLPIQIVFGFSTGVMPLIGYNYASENFPRMKEAIKKTYILTISSLLVVTALFNLGGRPIIRFFMDTPEVVSVGSRFLSAYGFSMPLLCIDFMVVGISQAFGYGKYAMIFSFLRKAFLEIPFMLLLNRIVGFEGVPYAPVATELIMAAAALFVQSRLLSKKSLEQTRLKAH